MPSSLAWLDHDAAARERTRRILALFQEKGTRDQLGIGGIRDALSDLLFPGTSTIQTRLRYFVIVPWIYTRLEEDGVPANRFGAEARRHEVDLIAPLLSAKEEGVFGASAGGDLKRLPSDVYWGGLGQWGIRRFQASRDQYHRAVDEIYRRRRAARHLREGGTEPEPGVVTWHPDLPAPPETFPDAVTLSPTRQEAEFLSDRIVGSNPRSLLAWLALRADRTSVRYPWEHPRLDEMTPEHRRILAHARTFSEVMHGAALLYNLLLSEEGKLAELADRHAEAFAAWAAELTRSSMQSPLQRPVLPSNLRSPRAPASNSAPPSPASRLLSRAAPSYLAFPGLRAFEPPFRYPLKRVLLIAGGAERIRWPREQAGGG